MEQSLLIFESSPLYLLLCAAFAVGISLYFYRKGKHSWSKKINNTLFIIRVVLVFLVTGLLLSPILKYLQNQTEEPIVVVAIDNSNSIGKVVDSLEFSSYMDVLQNTISEISDNGYNVRTLSLSGEVDNTKLISIDNSSSDLSGILKQIENQYEGSNLNSVVLLSDGIYNSGVSPTYSSYGFDLYTVGIGDSVPKTDLSIQNVRFNRVSYQGNKFPIRVSVLNDGFSGQTTSVSLLKGGNVISSQQINFTSKRGLSNLEFMVDANQEGTQRFVVQVSPFSEEFTTANNSKTIFIDVVEGKEKILLISERPHPDIKALKEAIEVNPNYSFETYIRGVSDNDPKEKSYDLIVCHQCTGNEGFIQAFGLDIENQPLWILYGKQMSVSALNSVNLINFEAIINEFDIVTPASNTAFSGFDYSDELRQLMREFPPLIVPFGDISTDYDTEALLFQRVGSIETPKPLLVLKNEEPRKALLLGEGLWRWKLHDFLRNDDNQLFTELISKIVQFLSTREDKQKLRVTPTKSEFTDQTVILETEIYNDLYERLYNIPVSLKVRNEAGELSEYNYSTSSSNSQYRITGLESGVYTYTANASIGEVSHTYNGQFIVNELQLEFINLTADFRLLRKLAEENNGTYLSINAIDRLPQYLNRDNAKGVIHSTEAYDPLINLPWLLAIILLIASVEWFMRKFYGLY